MVPKETITTKKDGTKETKTINLYGTEETITTKADGTKQTTIKIGGIYRDYNYNKEA